jgi:hypothetical protein
MLEGIEGILKQLGNWGSEHQLYYTVFEALDQRDKPGPPVRELTTTCGTVLLEG